MIVRHTVTDRVLRADRVEERREQRQGVAFLGRREVGDPLVPVLVRIRWVAQYGAVT